MELEETFEPTKPQGKVYKSSAFWVGTFIGGPLAAGYFFAKNFKVFGEDEKIKPTWIFALLISVLVLLIAILIPEDVEIPNQLIPLAYTGAAFGLFYHFQEAKAKTHLDQGGAHYSWGNVLGVSIISFMILVIPIAIYVFTADAIDQANTVTKVYGIEVKHEIDYDKTNISESEIDILADGFITTGFFDRSVEKYIYIEKEENTNTYIIKIPVIEGLENDPEGIQYFKELREQMDLLNPSRDIVFHLVFEYLDNVVVVLKADNSEIALINN